MPRLYNAARVTTRAGAIWRHCHACDELAALAPGDRVCPACLVRVPVGMAPVLHGIGARDRVRGL